MAFGFELGGNTETQNTSGRQYQETGFNPRYIGKDLTSLLQAILGGSLGQLTSVLGQGYGLTGAGGSTGASGSPLSYQSALTLSGLSPGISSTIQDSMDQQGAFLRNQMTRQLEEGRSQAMADSARYGIPLSSYTFGRQQLVERDIDRELAGRMQQIGAWGGQQTLNLASQQQQLRANMLQDLLDRLQGASYGSPLLNLLSTLGLNRSSSTRSGTSFGVSAG